MRNPSDNLFQLIKSLDQAEKRYFKIYVDAMKKVKVYAQLFDAIDRQKIYDEKKVLKYLEKRGTTRHFPLRKNQLFALILKVMADFHSEKRVDMQVGNLLNQVKFLFIKRQYKLALPLINKGKKLCQINELVESELRFLKMELVAHQRVFDVAWLGKNLESNYAETKRALRIKENLIDYEHLYFKIFAEGIAKDKGFETTKKTIYDEVMGHELMSEESRTLSIGAKRIFFDIVMVSSFMAQDNNHALEILLKTKQLLKENETLFDEFPSMYFGVLKNIVALGLSRLPKKELIDIQEEIKELQRYKSIDQNRLLLCYYAGELDMAFTFGDYEQLSFLIENEVVSFIDKYPVGNADKQFLILCCSICFFYFSQGSINKALTWFIKTQPYADANIYENLFRMLSIVQILLHSELENWTLVDSLIRAARRRASNLESKLELEDILFSFFKNTYPKVVDDKEQLTESFVALKKKLSVILNEALHEDLRHAFDFVAWCDSKIEDKPLLEILKRKARKN